MSLSILITGATGSFGRAFTRRILALNHYDRVCLFSRGEHAQADLRMELGNDSRCRWFIGDVRDQSRLKRAMQGVDVVVHAAAMKRVETCEADPAEAIKTNIIGALNVVDAALDAGVQKIMALSSDKATSAATLYGSTKYCAERLFVASNVYGAGQTAFSCVRYGNVEGSAGSVIPLFKKLIAGGADSLPITDVRMTRFFFAIEDAVEFTLSSIDLMRGGEVFIPKITARRIVDLATEMAPHLPHRIIGMRGNEKLHEVMLSEDESAFAYDIGDRYVLATQPPVHLGGKKVAEGFSYSSSRAIDGARLEAAE